MASTLIFVTQESDLAMGPFFPASERLEIAQPSTVFYMEELRILAGRETSQQSSPTAEPAQGGAQRLLSTVWWLATLVLMNAFCGHMRACLMIKSEVEKIESAEDLVSRPQTVPYMWLGTSYVATVANSTNPHQRKIGRVIRDRGTAVPVQELYGRALLEKVAQGRAAIISDATSLAFQVSSKCQDFVGAEYYLAREGLVSHPLNSFARKDIDPELFKNINKVIRRLLEAGLVNYWWGIAMGDMGPCGGNSPSSSGPEQASTLTFDDVLGVFVLWLACAAASCVAFLAETSIPGKNSHKGSKVVVTGWRGRRLRRLPRTHRVV
ncbi:hypothetical protein MTO96_009531 [Rhipicephalus appendiculatus]